MAQLEKVINSPGKIGYRNYGLPSQTVSVDEKETDEWKQGCMDYMRQEARQQGRDKVRDLKKYRYLADDYDYKGHSWVMDPLNLGDKKEEKYGATDPIQHYPIMNSPLNTIWGERINRPIQLYCLSESPASFNMYNEEKTDLLHDNVFQSIQQKALQKVLMQAQQQGIKVDEQSFPQLQQQAQQMSLPAIQKYMDEDYIDVVEQSANRMMRNMWKKNNLEEEFIEGFRHGTICGKERYMIHVHNSCLSIKNLSPFSVFYRKSPSTRWISEGQMAGYRLFLTPSSLIDMYRASLTVDDITKIEGKIYPTNRSQGFNSLTGIKSITYDTTVFADNQGTTWRDVNNDVIDQMVTEFQLTGTSAPRPTTSGLIEVTQAYWKSYRKAGFLHYYDDQDEEITTWVDENYVPDKKKGEWVKWYFLNQVYQGTIIDEDIYIDIEPYPHQIFDASEPDFAPLPIEGCDWNDFNGKSITITDLMMPWAEMYDIVAYELKRDMKKSLGKVMYMSIDHVPNIPGFDMDKWMYWAREFGIAWVGEGKKKTNFAHFSAADMSFAEQINAKILLLDKLKMNCDAFAGFSQPRLSDASREQTAQQSKMSIASSVNQTEYYFWKHTQIAQRVLSNALNIAKKILPENITYLRNLYDDMEIRYLTTDAQMVRNSSIGLYVMYGQQAMARRDAMRQMAMIAAGKTGEAVDMADLVMAETENEIKKILRQIRRKTDAIRQQDYQLQQDQIQMEAKKNDEDRAWEKEKHYTKLASDERKAFIQTFNRQADNLKDENDNQIPDVLEYADMLETQADNLRKHQREIRKQDQTRAIEDKKIKLKEKEIAVKEDSNQVDRENQHNDLQIAKENAKGRSTAKKSK